MLKVKIGIVISFLIVLSGCATFDDTSDEMIPPSANYSPVQTPVYPPLNQPYSPNLLNDNNSKVMNIDRLNVGEANISGNPQIPQSRDANPFQDSYTRDQRGSYTPTPSYIPSQNYIAPNEIVPYTQSFPSEKEESQTIITQKDNTTQMIQNSPILSSSNIIELSAVGMGVAPESTISPSQALALAKRAAIIDAYRQIGEKMYGIRLNAQDTVRDMVLINSVVKTKVEALIKNAEIIETVYKDGLCQITMELKLDGKIWHKILSNS